MSDSTEFDRYVFDSYCQMAATVYAHDEVPPSSCVVVMDGALVNDVDGSSMPNDGDYVTIAGSDRVIRGKVIAHAYVVVPE